MSKLNKTKLFVSLLLLSFVCFAAQGFAQSQASTGQISGAVKDSAGAVIVGATIRVTNIATGFTQSVTSGDNGLYRAVLLPPGQYNVTISHQGFADAVALVDVGVGRTAELNAALSVSGRKEEVNVTAEAVEVTRHEASAFINTTIVADMPLNGRKFQDLALLTPSAIVESSRQQISMVGQRGINASLNIDGSDYGNPFFGGLRGGERSNFAPTVPQEAIQEFQMVRAGYSAEFGRSTGGIMTAITKSGTNRFHGDIDYNIRHQDLSKTNQFFRDQTTQLQTKPGCGTCILIPAPTLQQWGGSLGGPIKRDKWFFYGAYTQQRNRIPHVVLFDQLSAAGVTRTAGPAAYDFYLSQQGPYEQTNDAKALLLKTDYQVGSAHRLSVKYGHSSNNALNAATAGTAILPNVTSALSNNGTELDSTQTGVVQLASFFGRLTNDLRTEYTRETRPRNANAQLPTVSNNIGTFGTVSFLGQNIEKDWRLQLADSIGLQKGTHSFKFGGEWSHLNAFQLFGFNQNGALGFNTSNNNTLLNIMVANVTGVSLGSGKPTRYTQTGNLLDGDCGSSSFSPCVTLSKQIGNLKASLVGNQISLFVQDSWRIRNSLTINYGLRWEGSQNPQPEATNTAMVQLIQATTFPIGRTEDPSVIRNQWNQFAPRLGFAWDPKGNGKTVIRGFGGIYFAATPLLVFAGPENNFRATPGDVSISVPYNVNIPAGAGACSAATPGFCTTLWQQFNLIGINLNQYGTASAIPASVFSVSNLQKIATALGSSLKGGPPDPNFPPNYAPILVDRRFHNPTSYQAGFGFEREIAHNWTLGTDFVWVNTVFLERNLELNLPVPTISATDPARRPQYGVASNAVARPISKMGSIQARDSSARSLYRGLTFNTTMRRKWGQFMVYYTLSQNNSNDDNERDSGGIKYENAFPVCGGGVCAPGLASQYGFSNLDRKHQFVASPVFYLPKGFEVSSAIRYLTGAPFDATQGGSDLNGDTVRSNDYVFSAVGVPLRRNSFRNLGFSTVDLRVQKAIKFKESMQLKISAEMFNLFNAMNITYGGNTSLNFCTPTSNVCGISGQTWTQNIDFRSLRENTATSPFVGQYLGNNNPGAPFQVQFSARFQF